MLVWKIFFLIYTSGILLTCFYIFSLERIIILVSCVHIKTKQFNFDFSQSAWAFQLVKSQFCCHNSLRQQDFPDNIQLFWWIFPILKISSSSIQLKIGDRKNQALFLKWTTERYNNDLNENKKVSMSDPFDQFIFFKLQAIALSLFKLLLTNTLKILFEMSSMTMIASSSVLFPGK